MDAGIRKGVHTMSPVVVSLIAFILLIACASGAYAVESLAGGRKGLRR
jgi:hypothetical protein